MPSPMEIDPHEPPPDAKRRRVDSQHVPRDFKHFARPMPKNMDEKNVLQFMQVDIDSYNQAPDKNFTQEKTSQVAVVQMFGVTKEGYSVVAHIHGVMPYLYVELPPGGHRIDCAAVMANLEAALKEAQGAPRGVSPMVMKVELVKKQNIWNYNPDGMKDFLKITVAVPRLVSMCRTVFERGLEERCAQGREPWRALTYESNTPFALRYMIDEDISGGCWCEAKANKLKKNLANKIFGYLARCDGKFCT